MIKEKYVLQCNKCKGFFRKQSELGKDIELFEDFSSALEVGKYHGWEIRTGWSILGASALCPVCKDVE